MTTKPEIEFPDGPAPAELVIEDLVVGVNFAVAAEHQATLMDRMTTDLEGAAAKARLIILGKPIPGVRERLPAGVPVLDVTRLQDVA